LSQKHKTRKVQQGTDLHFEAITKLYSAKIFIIGAHMTDI